MILTKLIHAWFKNKSFAYTKLFFNFIGNYNLHWKLRIEQHDGLWREAAVHCNMEMLQHESEGISVEQL